DWTAGQYFGTPNGAASGMQLQPLTEWSIDRELATDLPDEMRQAAGLSAAMGNFDIAAPSDATLGHFSPWRTPLQYLKAPVELSVYTDGEEHKMFVGSTDTVGSNDEGVILSSSALDGMADLDRPITMPAFGGSMGSLTSNTGLNPGLRAEWVVEHA